MVAQGSGLVNAAGIPVTSTTHAASSQPQDRKLAASGQDGLGQKDSVICDADQDTFIVRVIEASMETPVLVDFWAPWCEPCKQYTPLIEAAVQAESGRVRLVKVNVDDNPAIAQQLQIRSLPTTMVFINGQPVEAIPGVLPKQTLDKLIAQLLKMMGKSSNAEEIAAMIDTAEGQLADDPDMALQLFQQVLAQQSDHPAAVAGVIRAFLSLGDSNEARTFYDSLTAELQQEPLVQDAYVGIELAAEPQDQGQLAELALSLQQQPENLELRFDLAEAMIAAQQYDTAIDHLLHIIRTDSTWQDKRAHQCLLDLFAALGFKHPLSKSGRQRLSSLLFA